MGARWLGKFWCIVGVGEKAGVGGSVENKATERVGLPLGALCSR